MSTDVPGAVEKDPPGDTTPHDPIISLRGAAKSFRTGKSEVHAVDGVDLDVRAGEIFGVIGYSGAGKSTLVRLINALERPTSGSVVVDGVELAGVPEGKLRHVRATIGMIFQQFNLFASRTVAQNVAYPLKVAGWARADRGSRVAELLDFVGIADKAGSYPSQLSGGQKQRVGIARALATNPKILLADEATSALDPETTQDVLGLLRRVNRELGITVVVITHEMDVVRQACHRVAVMEHGKVVELGGTYEVFSTPQQAVTRRFVATALKDRPSSAVLGRLRERHSGRIVTIGVDEVNGSSALLTRTLREHGVDGTVVYGGITEVAERPYGSLTVELVGGSASVEEVVTALRAVTDVVDLGTTDDPRDDPSAVVRSSSDDGSDAEHGIVSRPDDRTRQNPVLDTRGTPGGFTGDTGTAALGGLGAANPIQGSN